MDQHSDPDATRTFLAIACSRSLLSPESVAEVTRLVENGQAPVADVLIDKGLMDPVEVDIVETLMHPLDAFPGYEVLEVLGRGGMGVVYRARQIALQRQVAIKTILLAQTGQSKLIPRFEKEAVTVAGLRHPNIVTAFDFGRQGNRLFFVMELLEGEDLEARIKRQGKLDERTAWHIARQAASGLAHAALQGIVHRDVKPANLLLVDAPAGFGIPSGVSMVKITDFGLVFQAGDLEASRLTMAGTSLGTPAYMAPEQMSSSAVDHRADIYALGATTFHMLSGRPPFQGETLWQIVALKSKGELPDLTHVASPASVRLLRDMMAVDPAQRIATYPQLTERIDSLLTSNARTTIRLPRRPAFLPSGRIARWLSLAAFLFGLIVLALVLSWPRLTHRQPSPMVPTGWHSVRGEPLYDGQTLAGWRIVQGSWKPARDGDGGRILAGRGIALRSLPNVSNYRLRVDVDLHQATAVELQFGITESPLSIYVLRVSQDGVDLGWRAGASGVFQTQSPVHLPLARPDESGEMLNYHELRLERINDQWTAYFDDNVIGTLVCQPQEKQAFRLATEGGPAYFESLEIAELVPPPLPGK